MSLHTLNPTGGPDLSRNNKRSLLYVTTDPTANNENDVAAAAAPDGSIRFLFTPGESEAHIELKTSGIWNDAGLRVASSSLSLGRDLRLGAAGGFVETFNESEIDQHLRALLPHIQFTAAGTISPAHMPILDKREDIVVFPGPATGQITDTTIGQVFQVIPTRLLHSTTHTTGTAAAIAEVQLTFYKGTDNTGTIINRLNIPASVMPASTTFTISYPDDFGFENEVNIFFEFLSVSPFSLVTNALGQVITTQNGHVLDELDIILDELVVANDLSLTFDNVLGFVVNNRF